MPLLIPPKDLASELVQKPETMHVERLQLCGAVLALALDALDHIAKTAAAARTPTRRLRWIQHRATLAHAGEIYDPKGLDLPSTVDRQIDRLKRQVATAIHWPDCWDTAAYPTELHALREVYAGFKCSNHPCARCAGSGETTALMGGGPEAYDVPITCPDCNGEGRTNLNEPTKA